MTPSRISILGVGLLGGSTGLAAKAALSDCHVVGYGHRKSTLDTALSIGAIDEAAETPAAAVQNCNLVILCTPVGLFGEVLQQIAPALSPDAVVTDVGSTKRSVVQSAAKNLKAPGRFVGSHPMAGSEKRGIEFARADLYRNALCIVTPTSQTDADALSTVEQFWKLLGMRLVTLDPETHDRMLADVSHLPHAIAAALVSMQTDQATELCGKGFLDATRIAGGDGSLWRDILLDNRDNLIASLQRFRGETDRLLSFLHNNDGEGLKTWLDTAAGRREALALKKLRELNPD